MKFWSVAIFTLMGTTLALADQGGIPHHGAPGPVAAAGLPVLVVAGSLWLYRRYRRRR
jgi:hypothetical protein